MDKMIWCFSNTSLLSRTSLEWRATMVQHCSKSCSMRLTQQHQSTWNSIAKPLRGAKIQEHKRNVIEMCNSIERHFQAIVENGHACDAETYRRHILDALLSGPNADFNTRMKSIKSDVDAGYGYNANVAPATLRMSANKLYTNISRLN